MIHAVKKANLIWIGEKGEYIRTLNRGVEQLVARWAHNPKVVSSSLAPATRKNPDSISFQGSLFY